VTPEADIASYGDASQANLNQPIVGMAVTPSGRGYWLVASDGGIFSFGDARFYGSTGGLRLNQPIVGMAVTPSGRGYWLVASDGGIFTFGDAPFRGAGAGRALPAPAIALVDIDGMQGYWLALSNGQVRAFGDAPTLDTAPIAVPVQPAWPAQGQAALEVPGDGVLQSPNAGTPEPIASLAKVMTAYVILRDYPLAVGGTGFETTVTPADVADLEARQAEGQSTLPVVSGEVLNEYQLLEGLLIPSGNNIAAILAQVDAGGIGPFVAKMNATAQTLRMTRTAYTDPSGFDPRTVSTAADQTTLGQRAMTIPVFAQIVSFASATLPVAGTVANYDRLLGADGFVGIKTGSEGTSGGCFLFADNRVVGGRPMVLYGSVLGQNVGGESTWALLDPAFAASRTLADSVVAQLAGPG